jgi:ATP-binding cassette, subfamily B, bacterial
MNDIFHELSDEDVTSLSEENIPTLKVQAILLRQKSVIPKTDIPKSTDEEKIAAVEGTDEEKVIAVEGTDEEKAVAVEGADEEKIAAVEGTDEEKVIAVEDADEEKVIAVEGADEEKIAAVESTEPQAPMQKQEPVVQQKPRSNILHGMASFWQSKLRWKVPLVLQLTAVECGAACLAMILSYYGRQTRVREIRDGYGIGRDGLSAMDIIRAARSYGMRVRAISLRGQIDEFRFVSLPVIIHWEFNHFMVVERWSAKYVDVVDPAVGRKRLSREAFELGFTGIIILMEPGEQFGNNTPATQKMTLGSYAAQYVKRAPITLVQLLLASLCLEILGLGVPFLTKLIVDQIIPHSLSSAVPLLGIAVLSLFLAQAVVLVLRSLLLIYLEGRIDMHIYPNFFDHLFMLPLKFFQQRSTGDILTRISSNSAIRDIVSTQFLSTLLDGSLVIVYMIILLWQSWLFGLIVVGLGMLQFVLLLGMNSEFRLRADRELEAIGKSQGYVAEVLSGMTTVKAAGAEQRVFQKWYNLFCDQLNASIGRIYLASMLGTAISILRMISPLVLLWLGVVQVLNGTMQLGTMIALNSLASIFMTPLASLASSATQLPIIRSHLERIGDVMEADIEQEVQQAEEPPQLTGRIQLQHVTFKYDGNSPAVLKDISIDIAPGQKIAIVGPTGSGKSTLGKLLLGLYLPTEGDILYDGLALRSLNYQSVRSQFGVIMQDARIFSGSIWQNIAFNNPGMDMDNIMKAAKLAALDEDIAQMPMGYESFVAEAGNTLSGGQRQRLAIARALANNPTILLLDEATSALDVITERIIEQNLKALACTQIIIAHRLSTVRDADTILVLYQGSIVESGSHAELLEKQGYYAKLIQNQLTS